MKTTGVLTFLKAGCITHKDKLDRFPSFKSFSGEKSRGLIESGRGQDKLSIV